MPHLLQTRLLPFALAACLMLAVAGRPHIAAQAWNTRQHITLTSQGPAWVIFPSPVAGGIRSISMVSSNDGWATTGNEILHWDGTAWTARPNPLQGYALGAVSMASTDEGWITANGWRIATTLHWDGQAWSRVDAGIPSYMVSLSAVDALSSGTAWAVGGFPEETACHLLAWNGTTWYDQPYSGPTWCIEMDRVDMLSATDGWITGMDSTPPRAGRTSSTLTGRFTKALHATDSLGTFYLHWNGYNWQEVAGAPIGYAGALDMVSHTDGWAAGTLGPFTRWDGTTWNLFSNPTTWQIADFSMLSPADGWAVGANGTLLHWDEADWTLMPSPTSEYLYDVEMLSVTEGWAVGEHGTILHYGYHTYLPEITYNASRRLFAGGLAR